MKYKYEFFEENFERGCCDDCPLSYEDEEYTVYCVLHKKFEECPLQEVEI